MLGACLHNERDGRKVPVIYGCVTNGELWHFLKLKGTELQFHPDRLGIKEIGKIMWMLVQCVRDVDQQASDAA